MHREIVLKYLIIKNNFKSCLYDYTQLIMSLVDLTEIIELEIMVDLDEIIELEIIVDLDSLTWTRL